jgi:fatty acid desaturase
MSSPAVLSEPNLASSLPGSPRLAGVVTAAGETWAAFRLTLEPRWDVVRRDLARYYACIVGGLLAHTALVLAAGNWVGLSAAPLAGAWIGYWVHSVSNFLHEAAHFNLHPDKLRNDQLANRLLCPLVGEEIAHYRAVHWQHHLHLGDPADTEVSYRNALSPRFLIESLTGLSVLRVLRTRQRALGGSSVVGSVGAWPLLRAALLHGSVVLIALLADLPSTALAWAIAVAMVYPFCNAVRQLLEHRALDAPLDADFSRVAHGAVNRLFGTDPLSRSFGAAGFNRHLLHHWHPAASYTRFDELERFLLQTPLQPALEAARTSYWATWRALARAARGARPA